MAKCPKCNGDIPENAKVCPSCNQPLGQSEEAGADQDKKNVEGFERYSSTNPPELATLPKPEPDHTISLGSSQQPDHGDIQLSPSEEIFEQSLIATRRYKIKKLVGRGGMGLVYLAFDRELGLEVALKSLPAEATNDPRYLEMLKQEAKLSMQLTHHNIVRLFDLKSEGNSRFMVMEFIPGFSLNDYLLLRGKLSEQEAWDILKPVCQALAYAHSQKIIHRDIKPGNILFKTNLGVKELAEYYEREKKFPAELDIKVADFGIARTVSDTMARVTHVPVSGTLSYMSSEQLRGKRQTSATDVYSLAAVAYELLCGHPPFHSGEIQYQILNEPPEPIPGAKQEYMDAILKGLSKNPDDRPPTVLDFLEMPEKILRGETAAEPTAPETTGAALPGQPQKLLSRKYINAALAALLAVSLALSIYFISRRFQPGPEPAPAQKEKDLLDKAWQFPDAADGWVNALSTDANSEYLASAGGNIIKLWVLDNGAFVRTIESHKAQITALAFSPANNALASSDQDGQIDILDFAHETTTTIKAGQQVNALCYSPDGKILASASPGAIKLWDPETGKLVKTFKGLILFPSNALDFSPDGRMLAAAGANSIIKLWDPLKNNPVATIRGNFFKTINSVAFNPDDQKILATAGSDQKIQFWQAPSGNKIKALSGHAGSIMAIAFSPDGNQLASMSEDKTIKIWSFPAGNLLQSIPAGISRSLAFNGKYLAFGGCAENAAVSCRSGKITVYRTPQPQSAPSGPESSVPTAPKSGRGRKTPKSETDPGFHKFENFLKRIDDRIKKH